MNTEIVSINPEKNEVFTKEGKVVVYDRLLLAVGANCFVPPIPGADSKKVFTVKDKHDTDRIMELAESATHRHRVGIGPSCKTGSPVNGEDRRQNSARSGGGSGVKQG